MAILEYDTFLSELARMFSRSKTAGSVSITMKRYDGRTKPVPRLRAGHLAKKGQPSQTTTGSQKQTSTSTAATSPSSTEYHCLIRAKLRNKKISTVVHAKDVNKFHMAFVTVLKGNMDALKKRLDKKGSKGSPADKKTRATQ